MTETKPAGVHWSFWAIGVVTLIWNAMGGINFIVQMMPDMITAYPESEQAIIMGRPLWATIAFGAAVFAGAFGCILLLMRKSSAYYLFIASLIGVIITMVHTFSTGFKFETGETIGLVFMPIIIAVFLIWYAKYAGCKGWISN